jgi:hypothetical protein
MTTFAQPGILAVWNDCRPGGEAEYEAWYQGEHLRERVAVPGFVFARRFVAIQDVSPRYFTFYETETPEVLRSAAYLERGANPTPMTQRIMSGIFQNMTRTVCRRTQRTGEMEGAHAVTIRATSAAAATLLQAAWPQAVALRYRLRAELWLSAETPGQTAYIEEKLRGADKKIDACLLIEFSDAAHATDAAYALHADFRATADIAICAYRLMASLRRSDLTPTGNCLDPSH